MSEKEALLQKLQELGVTAPNPTTEIKDNQQNLIIEKEAEKLTKTLKEQLNESQNKMEVYLEKQLSTIENNKTPNDFDLEEKMAEALKIIYENQEQDLTPEKKQILDSIALDTTHELIQKYKVQAEELNKIGDNILSVPKQLENKRLDFNRLIKTNLTEPNNVFFKNYKEKFERIGNSYKHPKAILDNLVINNNSELLKNAFEKSLLKNSVKAGGLITFNSFRDKHQSLFTVSGFRKTKIQEITDQFVLVKKNEMALINNSIDPKLLLDLTVTHGSIENAFATDSWIFRVQKHEAEITAAELKKQADELAAQKAADELESQKAAALLQKQADELAAQKAADDLAAQKATELLQKQADELAAKKAADDLAAQKANELLQKQAAELAAQKQADELAAQKQAELLQKQAAALEAQKVAFEQQVSNAVTTELPVEVEENKKISKKDLLMSLNVMQSYQIQFDNKEDFDKACTLLLAQNIKFTV